MSVTVPFNASTGIFPSGEELWTTGETISDISKQREVNCDRNCFHNECCFLGNVLENKMLKMRFKIVPAIFVKKM